MSYKVTALKNVRVLANILTPINDRIGDKQIVRTGEKAVWIALKSGEVRDGLGMVWGADPSLVPNEITHRLKGYEVATGGSATDEELPKEFFGLFRLEVSTSERV